MLGGQEAKVLWKALNDAEKAKDLAGYRLQEAEHEIKALQRERDALLLQVTQGLGLGATTTEEP